MVAQGGEQWRYTKHASSKNLSLPIPRTYDSNNLLSSVVAPISRVRVKAQKNRLLLTLQNVLKRQ